MELTICHLYPDVLNLYGDRGNIMCMKKRLEWRGIDAKVIEVPIGSPLPAEPCDIYFIGGGQDFEQEVLLEDLRGAKAEALKGFVEDGRVLLAICGGFQILGKYYDTGDGKHLDFPGVLNTWTKAGNDRLIGNYMYKVSPEDGGFTVVGFENHSGRTYLGEGVRPFGEITVGSGNNGEDKAEGARYKNAFCTYSHGPVLPKNPEFCDRLLSIALGRKYPDYTLSPLNDNYEHKASEYMINRIGGQAQ